MKMASCMFRRFCANPGRTEPQSVYGLNACLVGQRAGWRQPRTRAKDVKMERHADCRFFHPSCNCRGKVRISQSYGNRLLAFREVHHCTFLSVKQLWIAWISLAKSLENRNVTEYQRIELSQPLPAAKTYFGSVPTLDNVTTKPSPQVEGNQPK